VVATHQVIHSSLIASPKTFPIVVTCARRDVRMTILIAIIDVGSTVIVVVFASAFDPIMESLPLYIPKLLRRCIPAAAILTVSKRDYCIGRSH
jgi:hypothetical protein